MARSAVILKRDDTTNLRGEYLWVMDAIQRIERSAK
jgi:hypothetical protein